ncbi:MAG TPA: histidine kinase [Mucilaginibacter sp.]
MKVPGDKYFNNALLKTNLKFGALGILIGVAISAFESVINNKLLPSDRLISNLIFSTIITLSIANAVYVFVCFWKVRKNAGWMLILIYYGCSMMGMLVGIELSYLVTAIIFDVPFHFLSHFGDYRFNFLIVVVVCTVVYFYRAQHSSMNARLREKELDLVKAKQLITQAELQTLQSKINPHFLYNSLNSIASLIHEDADKAEDMTLKLSQLFRYSINSPQENMAPVTEEMEIVNTYLAIEKIRFGDRLSFTTHIDDSVKNSKLPRFLLQPLVENALKHGLNGLANNGELKISITRDSENIVISIADNGKPFPAELNMGYGLQSTYDKLSLLYGENYRVQITNSPEKQIRILIPATI